MWTSDAGSAKLVGKGTSCTSEFRLTVLIVGRRVTGTQTTDLSIRCGRRVRWWSGQCPMHRSVVVTGAACSFNEHRARFAPRKHSTLSGGFMPRECWMCH